MYTDNEIEHIESEYSNGQISKSKRDRRCEYFANQVSNLTHIGGLAFGVVHLVLDYTTGSVSVDFDWTTHKKFRLIDIPEDIGFLEYASAIASAGVIIGLTNLNIYLNFGTKELKIDDRHANKLIDSIQIVDEIVEPEAPEISIQEDDYEWSPDQVGSDNG